MLDSSAQQLETCNPPHHRTKLAVLTPAQKTPSFLLDFADKLRSIPRPPYRVPARCLPRVLDEDCAPVPPLFPANGMSVYMQYR